MKTFLLNPTLQGKPRYIREGRCMQKASSWATAWPPVSLAILGALAKTWGEVRLVDGNVEKITTDGLLKDIRGFVRGFAPALVVINTGFPSINDDMDAARAIKEAFPAVKVLAFGVYFTLLEKEGFSRYPFLDFAITGEPEETFAELAEALHKGNSGFSDIKGIIYKEGNDVRQTPPRPFLADLDRLPHPDRGLLKNDRYRLPHNNRRYTLVNTARGCPHRCSFCIVASYYGDTVRRHSIPYILDELRECTRELGIRDFLFWEEAFTLDKKYLLDFCRALTDERLSVGWAATTRAGSLDEEIVVAMKKAGCSLIGLGIESASQEILDRANKKQTLDEVKKAMALCKKHALATMGHFIFGLPGETRETAGATIRFMLGLGLDYMQCYCAVPYPKTGIGAEAKAKGWLRARDWSQYDFGGSSIMCTDTMSNEEVDGFRSRAFTSFYFRPLYIIKRLFAGMSILQLPRIANFRKWMKLPR